MKIDINLKNGYGRLAVREPFWITEGEPVVLAFGTDYALRDVLVAFRKDGGEAQVVRAQNLTEIEVPAEYARAGVLSVELALLVAEKVVKRWTVEPIVFREARTGFSGHPEYEDILARLAELEAVANNHSLALSELQEAFGEMNETVTGIDSIVNDPLE